MLQTNVLLKVARNIEVNRKVQVHCLKQKRFFIFVQLYLLGQPATGRVNYSLDLRETLLWNTVKQAVPEAATICPNSCKLTLDLLTLKAVSESSMTWASSVPILIILIFLGLSC